MPRFLFDVNDSLLRDEISAGLVPHLDIKQVGFHARGREVSPRAHLSIVCVSNVTVERDLRTVDESRITGRHCALIVKTEDRATWNRLAGFHRVFPFALVIAMGGPRDKLRSYFPGAVVVSDITSLREPGRQIADVLEQVASKQEPLAVESSGPIPPPYASAF